MAQYPRNVPSESYRSENKKEVEFQNAVLRPEMTIKKEPRANGNFENLQDNSDIPFIKTENFISSWPVVLQEDFKLKQEQQVAPIHKIKQEIPEMLIAYKDYVAHQTSSNEIQAVNQSVDESAPCDCSLECNNVDEGSRKKQTKKRKSLVMEKRKDKKLAVSNTRKQIDKPINVINKTLHVCLVDILKKQTNASYQTHINKHDKRGQYFSAKYEKLNESENNSLSAIPSPEKVNSKNNFFESEKSTGSLIVDSKINKDLTYISEILPSSIYKHKIEYSTKVLNKIKAKNFKRGILHDCVSSKNSDFDLTSSNRNEYSLTGDVNQPDLCSYGEKSCFSISNKNINERIHMAKMPYFCSYCKTSFSYLSTKYKHKRIHTGEKPYVCRYCKKRFSDVWSKKGHERSHTGGELYFCSYCKKSFIDMSVKNRHERLHTHQQPHSCSYCKKSFSNVLVKNVHERSHTREKLYSCSYCKKSFSHLSSKSRHERIHTGEKLYCCSYCKKSFSCGSLKNAHERIHTGEKPHFCSYCKKSFIHLSSKNRHERIHTIEMPFSCSYCQKSFYDLSAKNRHERIHTGEMPHSCSYCKKSFLYSWAKNKHELIHRGEKPHSCSYCKKSFFDKSTKNRHERIHTGEQRYFCSYCTKSFSEKSTLISHEFIHTNKMSYSGSYCKNHI